MRPLLLAGLFFVLLPIAWSRLAPPGVYMETWPDGSIKVRAVSSRTPDGDYVFDGPYVAYHANGRKERQGEMREGKEEGLWRWWTQDGALRAEGRFHRGSGAYTSYYPSGAVHWRGRFVDGLRDGMWTEFSEAGRELRRGRYRADREHGNWTYWSEDDPEDSLVVQWADGRMLEAGESAPKGPPSHPARETAGRVLLHLLGWGLLLAGPLPWSLAIARACRGEPPAAGLELLVVAVVWIAMQIAVGLGLGSVHLLRSPAVAAVEGALLLSGGWWLRSRRWHPPILRAPQEAPVRVMAFSWLVLALASFWWLVSMPTDNFDSLAYHLPVIVRWIQDASLTRPAELGQVAFYPFHWEVLAMLQVLPLGEDLAVALPNLLALGLLALAVFVLARDLGAGATGAWFAVAMISTLPLTLSRLPAIQPDLAVGAFFVAATALGRRAWRTGSTAGTLVWATSLGVLVGLKGSGLVYAALSVAFVALDGKNEARLRARAVLLGLLVVGGLGGYWYLRNWMRAGNPLGFVEVTVGGVTLWPGSVDGAQLRRGTLLRLFDPTQLDHWRILVDVAWRELGVPFLALLLGAAGLVWARTRRAMGAWSLARLVGWVVVAFLLYWITPYGADNGDEGWQFTPRIASGLRFGFPAWAALAVAASLGIPRGRRWALGLAAVAAAATGLGLVRTVEAGWSVAAAAVLLSLGVFATFRWRLGLRVVIPATVVAVTVALTLARGERDRWRTTLYGEAYEFVDRTVPRDAVVGYALTQTRYPYYGRGLDRTLIPVVPAAASYEQWKNTLKAERVQWLLLGTSDSGEEGTRFEPLVPQWVRAHPESFETAFTYQSRRRDITVVRVLD
jgi:hypothetical protein